MVISYLHWFASAPLLGVNLKGWCICIYVQYNSTDSVQGNVILYTV